MKKRKSKRIVSILLAATMVVSTFPAAAFAEDGTVNVESVTESDADKAPSNEAENGNDVVAQIGDTSYTSLAEAFKNAKEGDTVTLTAAAADQGMTIPASATNITVTANTDVPFTHAMRIQADGVTVTDMHFELSPAREDVLQNVIVDGAEGVTVYDNTFVIVNGKPEHYPQGTDWQPSAVWLEHGATDTQIKGNQFTLGQVWNNSSVGVNLVGGKDNPIKNTTIEQNNIVTGPKYGDGTSGNMPFIIGNGNENSDPNVFGIQTVNIKGNTYDGSALKEKSYFAGFSDAQDIAPVENTLNNVEYGMYNTSYKGQSNPSTWEPQNNTYNNVSNNNFRVADQDGREYVGIANAIEANATTAKLIFDRTENVTIPEGTTLTLDLNGHTLNGGNNNGESPALTNNGTITIKDSSETQTGTIKREDTAGTSSYYTIKNEGTMTIESGNITNASSGTSLIVNGYSKPGTLNISGGTIQQDDFIAVKNDEFGTLNITGGTIKSNNQAVQNWKDATISGGTLNGDVSSWAYAKVAGKTEITGDTVVTGNVIAAWYGESTGSDAAQAGVVPVNNINGGTFLGKIFKQERQKDSNGTETTVLVENTNAKGDVNVSGGQHANQVDPAFFADGVTTELKSNSNTQAPFTYYKDVNDAITNMKPGDKVTVVTKTDAPTVSNYDVTIKYGNGDSDSLLTIPENSEITLPSAPSRNDGYTFAGWSDGTTTYKAGEKVTINADTTFTAQWEPPYTGKYSYEITTKVGAGGAIKVDRYATEGEKVTITVTPDEAYLLDALTVTSGKKDIDLTDNGDGTYTFTMPSGDVKINATFAEDPNWEKPTPDPDPMPELPFTDVSMDDWFCEPVCWVYEQGLMTGTSATTFEPNLATTRGMIVSMLARLEGNPTARDAGFADVADGAWYADAVNWAAGEGIVSGYSDSQFGPNDPITREQMAAILHNYAEYKGMDVSARADLSKYADAGSISGWATDVLSWANAEGLVNGMTENTIAPKAPATRAQVAAIFQRFLSE